MANKAGANLLKHWKSGTGKHLQKAAHSQVWDTSQNSIQGVTGKQLQETKHSEE